MKFLKPLIKAQLLRRYKRFLADVLLEDGKEVTVYCPNPGSMLGLCAPGNLVWLSRGEKESSRKLIYTWEIVGVERILVGINTATPNLLVAEAISQNQIPELNGYTSLKREVKYGDNSRIDFLLQSPGHPPCYVEVKNVHLKRQQNAEFPDSITARGAKHLGELAKVRRRGNRAVLLYIVQRNDCSGFSLASDIDPSYALAAQEACNAGVECLCYQCNVTLFGIEISTPLLIKR